VPVMVGLECIIRLALTFGQYNTTPANHDGQRALCYDVGYQDALTVLVIASGWLRGVCLFGGG
jgi:hypothetical protein